MKSIRAWVLITAVALSAAAGTHTNAAPKPEQVRIPLDKSDARFGKFYVKALDSILYRAKANEASPAIVLLHGCGGIGGLTLQGARKYAKHFAEAGYATLILDVTDRRRLGNKPCNDRDTSFSLLDARRGDLDAAVRWLGEERIALPEKVVAIGFSHGGQVAIEHNQRNGGEAVLAGAIAFYPGCDRGNASARFPLLILVGDKDFTDGPARSLGPICSDYAKKVQLRKGARTEVVVYAGAGHSFDVEGMKQQVSQSLNKSMSGYDAAAAAASLVKIDEFLGDVFKP